MKWLSLLLLMVHSACWADIYMNTDHQGDVTYSDIPSSQSKKIMLDSPNTITAPTDAKLTNTTPSRPTDSNDDKPYADIAPYTDFSISSPNNGDTITNQPNITITATVVPALQKGDSIQFYLDNVAIAPASHATSIVIDHIDRGQHELRAALYDRNNNLVRQSQSVTVFIHYAHLGSQSTINR